MTTKEELREIIHYTVSRYIVEITEMFSREGIPKEVGEICIRGWLFSYCAMRDQEQRGEKVDLPAEQLRLHEEVERLIDENCKALIANIVGQGSA